MPAKPLFADAEEAVLFALGLKLFSEVMLKHPAKPLFAKLAPAFGAFIKSLMLHRETVVPSSKSRKYAIPAKR
jgi:hypothetical protein